MTAILDDNDEDLLEKYTYSPKKPAQKQPVFNEEGDEDLLAKYEKVPDIEKDTTYQKYYKAPEPSREEYKKMSLREKMQLNEDMKLEREYLSAKGTVKGVASGLSLGLSKKIPGLEPKEHELGFGGGELAGEFAPIMGISKILSLPLKLVPVGYKALSALGRIGASTITGSTLEASKESIAGEELDPYAIALKGLEFGALHSLFEGIPAAYNWFKSLSTGQKSQMLVDGSIPKNLSKDQWKFYSEEIEPALSKVAQEEYASALKTATEEANTQYQQKLFNAKAQHEREMFELAQQNKISDADAIKAQQQYDNKLKQVAAEHEMEMTNIQRQNQEALAEYQQKQQKFQQTKMREQAVEAAINRPMSEAPAPLQGRVGRIGEDLQIRPEPLPAEPFSLPSRQLKNRVGSIISPEPIVNKTEAGFRNMEAVRASDQADYANVNQLYNISEELNQSVEGIHPNLVTELDNIIREVDAIPEPSAPQKQIRTAAINTRNRLAAYDANDNLTGFRPVTNQMLLEQAKALRYALDFDFAHGNPKNIFKPMINALQDAAEQAAINTGNQAAYEANREARTAWREWNDLYGNDYIKKYRDRSNHEFIRTFDSSLNPDDFNLLNQVLGESNTGQQLAAQTRRELISNKLDKFYKNPQSAVGEEFNDVLRELTPVLEEGQEYAIRQQFIQARRSPDFIARKAERIEAPKEAKVKAIPEKVAIPTKKLPEKKAKEITAVKIPIKGEVKPTKEMQAAAKKMDRTPEQLMKMADTPTGLRELKTDLSKSEPGKKLFEKIGQHKVRDILYKGRIEKSFKGDELFDAISRGNNYSLLSEIIGEVATEDLLQASRQIADKKVTKDTLKTGLKKAGTLKALIIFGIL